MSKEWSEKREVFFRKMLQQGGRFKFDNKQFEVKLRQKLLNSQGEKDGGIIPIPGDSRF